MKRVFLLLHTVHYLKIRQVAYRLYYKMRKPRLKNMSEPEVRGVLGSWSGAAFFLPATDDGEGFTFLGETGDLTSGWNNHRFSKLWLYNLHYQDDLNAVGVSSRDELCRLLVENWIAANPPLQGNGWEPYCLSLRIVNWTKFFSRLSPDTIDRQWLRSLACQADALIQQLEFHILANHLFANAKALVFVGTFLGGRQGDTWLKEGLTILDQEVSEQFLTDGGHYELSPMYHATLLWDVCDLVQLQQQTQLAIFDERVECWRRVITQGVRWLRKLIHPDGDIAFFNDATLGIAPTLEQLERYAEQLGCSPSSDTDDDNASLQFNHMKASGYAVIDWPEQHRIVLDVGRVGPDYQPGHAHADTLSFELSLFAQRVLVNSGISQYGEGIERQQQRATSAHNTVEVDGHNSSEVWAGFRVARRAKPIDLSIKNNSHRVQIKAAHDGYQRLRGKVTHQRQWIANPSSLVIEDRVTGLFNQAKAYFHVHPAVCLERVAGSHWKGYLQNGQVVELRFEGGIVQQKSSEWHPGFGLSVATHCLIVTFLSNNLITHISWSET
ncbi:hypothetical protein BZG80_13270 [Salinivibrio sp. MA440]|uniref:heparinase II/III family protein n=1 Tax=Salinivibrio sp. MA440 TaxID=1909456 RepID=UPI000988D1B4|nr:heparinase II/III family protein [Salinivibrio sp. MA440]OOF02130.1 hypothetical protein BZG80_13270 [Salinivibrio sp. MA440]